MPILCRSIYHNCNWELLAWVNRAVYGTIVYKRLLCKQWNIVQLHLTSKKAAVWRMILPIQHKNNRAAIGRGSTLYVRQQIGLLLRLAVKQILTFLPLLQLFIKTHHCKSKLRILYHTISHNTLDLTDLKRYCFHILQQKSRISRMSFGSSLLLLVSVSLVRLVVTDIRPSFYLWNHHGMMIKKYYLCSFYKVASLCASQGSTWSTRLIPFQIKFIFFGQTLSLQLVELFLQEETNL